MASATWRRSRSSTPTPPTSPACSGRARPSRANRTPMRRAAWSDSLAQAVAQNRTALLALTALKNYDNYTFTHMVNVSILTMGQARGLGIDGPLLREFGLAALMHDIGKVKTPSEVLNKPGKLTDAEFDILKRHTVDGAEILKNTPEIPGARPHRRLRAPSAQRRHRLPGRRRAASAQPRHDAVRDCRRLRRDALAARLPAGAPDRSHPGRAAAQRRQAVRSASREAVRPARRDLSRRAIWCGSTPGKSRSSSRPTRPIRTGRASRCSPGPADRSWSIPTT